MLTWVFTAIYFLIFCVFIFLIGNEFLGIGAGASFLTIFCWIIAFFASVGLGEFTEKKIRRKKTGK